MQKNVHIPFLWSHLRNLDTRSHLTGGEERPLTESANEESSNEIIELG